MVFIVLGNKRSQISGAISYNENIDIQNVVHDIKYRNKLSNSDIYVGQVLEIPIY